MKYNLITIMGPTAVGKTGIAARLADEFNGEIISADSRQVYRGMDIGTGKDLEDYIVGQNKIKYHMIDICDPREEFNVFDFKSNFITAFEKINSSKKIPFLVGGSGLYLSSIVQNYQMRKVNFNSPKYVELSKMEVEKLRDKLLSLKPDIHNTTDLIDKERIIKAIIIEESPKISEKPDIKNIHSLNICITGERAEIKKNITDRLISRLKNGMVDEVKALVSQGVSFDKLMFFGLEYKFIAKYLKGEFNYSKMVQNLNTAIHQFSKRQMTWFRKMEKEGLEIHWFSNREYESISSLIREKYFNGK